MSQETFMLKFLNRTDTARAYSPTMYDLYVKILNHKGIVL